MGRAHARLAIVLVTVILALAACAQGGASSAAPSAASAAFVGTWKAVLTAQDWETSGISNVDENTGEFTLTFAAEGSWTMVQRSLTGVVLLEPVFTGTWTSQGEAITLTTSFPDRYKGFVDVLSYRVEGTKLHLTVTNGSDEYVVVTYGTHPWERS